ncbi:acetate--CoA ligase family protein [Amorphus coralli]|uniref:acetate--CoA ligase family protein n=1 Tax=Amorphus coralli TaxID=340680 RepID=UPI00037EECF8|nr:acetate--CoA ligase family protein [Amorphus coralli]
MADSPARTSGVARLLNPGSVAIVGASPKPFSLGGNLLQNFLTFGFEGDLHLVNPSHREISGHPCVATIDELPEGIDLVCLIVPAVHVPDAVEACARRKVGAVILYSAGFAETGEEGRAIQDRVARTAREAGIAMLGPNCMGYANFLRNVPATFEQLPHTPADGPGTAVVTQSGAMMGNLRIALLARGVPVSYAVSAGNEAVTSVEEIIGYLVEDPQVSQLAVFVEQLKKPALFLKAALRARELGKPIVMAHPGRSERSREAALSHTGAIAGDHAVMELFVRQAGVVLANGFDELFDIAAITDRFPTAPVSNVALMTNSGAVRGFALDFCEEVGLPVAPLQPETLDGLAAILPSFATIDNPLDITAQGMKEPNLFGDTTEILLADPGVDAVVVAVMGGSPAQIMNKWNSLRPRFESSDKPAVYVVLGDGHPMPQNFLDELSDSRTPFFRSPERALRAFARLAETRAASEPDVVIAEPGATRPTRTISEAKGKAILREAGIAVADFALAENCDAALKAAESIGYPVVLKAQADALAHKSDVGGVRIGIDGPEALAAAWDEMQSALATKAPGLALDGLLVERQATRPEAELIIASRRDPHWGIVHVVGMGGVWAETLKDVRLIPGNATAVRIEAEMRRLRSAGMLTGGRNQPPLDIAAAAAFVARLGDLMQARPDITEIEVNPLALYRDGIGVLDCLITVDS